jgi:hypothetical protein
LFYLLRLLRMQRGIPLACSLGLVLAASLPALARSQVPASPATLQGKLLSAGDAAPVLKTQSKEYRLAARTDWLLHTLQDKRLAGREIRVEGELQADGKFKVNHFFILRDGKVYRVRYFCEVCNIEALGPGNCVCCQQPTELQEIPVETRSGGL